MKDTRTEMNVSQYGPHALLIDCQTTAEALAVRDHLQAHCPWGRVRNGVSSVTVEWYRGDLRDEYAEAVIREALSNVLVAEDVTPRGYFVQIPIVYDGEDLERVARACDMTVRGVIEAHQEASYRVAAVGFAPGFVYLSGGDPRIQVPRLDEPRTQVRAGSVGVTDGLTCIYPTSSPGGWNLLGTTDVSLFDAAAQQAPALLRAGDTVRFVEAVG